MNRIEDFYAPKGLLQGLARLPVLDPPRRVVAGLASPATIGLEAPPPSDLERLARAITDSSRARAIEADLERVSHAGFGSLTLADLERIFDKMPKRRLFVVFGRTRKAAAAFVHQELGPRFAKDPDVHVEADPTLKPGEIQIYASDLPRGT
jgi:hypothetical protein